MKIDETAKIGLGGGCHWCTEAVFQALKGIVDVQQGYIASTGHAASFSEAIIVSYIPKVIPLYRIIEVHLHTHNATSNHSFREKYRSAVYYLKSKDAGSSRAILKKLQRALNKEIITQVLPFKEFRPSRESLQDYYLKNPDKPFCQRYIEPKLALLNKRFPQDLK